MFSDYNGKKLEINNIMAGISPVNRKLNNALLNNRGQRRRLKRN